jgi:hypothetical protein
MAEIDTLGKNRKSIIETEKLFRKADKKVEKKMAELATATQEKEAARQEYLKALEVAKSV